MKKLSLVAPIVLTLGGYAQAEQGHVLRGLFCNTEAQVDETLVHMRLSMTPQAAVELTNEKNVVCVYADKVQYMIIHPFIIGEARHRSVSLLKYEATLVGVLVGENLRPVEPPLQIFFVQTERLTGATALSRT